MLCGKSEVMLKGAADAVKDASIDSYESTSSAQATPIIQD